MREEGRMAGVEAMVCLASAWVAVRLLRTEALLRLGERVLPGAAGGRVPRFVAKRREDRERELRVLDVCVKASETAAARLGVTNCLERAMGLRLQLARRGLRSTLHLGVRATAGENGTHGILAHAWLSVNGVVVVGAEGLSEQYREFHLGGDSRCLRPLRPRRNGSS